MAKKGGFPGMMPGNMNNMLKQVQKMQNDMQKMQEELSNKEFETTSGGGAVTVRVNGKKELLSIKIKEEVVDKDDVEILCYFITTCIVYRWQIITSKKHIHRQLIELRRKIRKR